MLTLLRDLYGHQAWADAEHWRALTAHGPALGDPALQKRLHHIHVVQHAFLFLVTSALTPGHVRGDDPRVAMASPEPPAMPKVLDSARRYHEAAARFLAESRDEQLAAPIHIPWFPGGFTLSAGEALMQAAMHSHYHRGQNATRLRELGGNPPMTDLIFWYYKGRPAPDWTTKEPV